jgi:hypothetical protein
MCVVFLGTGIFACEFLVTANYMRSDSLSSVCGDVKIAEKKSPDGLTMAAVYERNCGATAGFTTMILVGAASQDVTPDNQGDVVFVASERPQFLLQWKSDQSLIVKRLLRGTYPRDQVFKRLPAWRNIRIAYR